MWVIGMTHRSDAAKSVIQNHIFCKFCVGGNMKFKNFDFIELQIKNAIDWYACHQYCDSRIRNNADVLKIEHMQLL